MVWAEEDRLPLGQAFKAFDAKLERPAHDQSKQGVAKGARDGKTAAKRHEPRCLAIRQRLGFSQL
jgi:hypothetical protein